MAGLIAGREVAPGSAYHSNNHNHFGVAPDARLISLKVADAKGLTDVSQVIAAIDWVIAHRKGRGHEHSCAQPLIRYRRYSDLPS